MAETHLILSGDIGGTNTRLCLFRVDQQVRFMEVLPTQLSHHPYADRRLDRPRNPPLTPSRPPHFQTRGYPEQTIVQFQSTEPKAFRKTRTSLSLSSYHNSRTQQTSRRVRPSILPLSSPFPDWPGLVRWHRWYSQPHSLLAGPTNITESAAKPSFLCPQFLRLACLGGGAGGHSTAAHPVGLDLTGLFVLGAYPGGDIWR